jgi:hypothetical protein
MPLTYIIESLINPTIFVVVWYAILKFYGTSLGFGSPNPNFNCYVIISTLWPPSNNTSSIVLFLMYTWITTIWLSIVTTIVPTFSTKKPTCLSMVVLLEFWVLFNFNLCYFFKLKSYFKQMSHAQNITCS